MPIVPNLAVQNIRNTPGSITDVFANRPAASTDVVSVGTIFISTDTQAIYSFDGTAWILIGNGTGGGGINPTSSYIPYNDSGTFQDSRLIFDGLFTTETLYQGIKIEQFNAILGDFNNNNSGVTFNVTQTGPRIYSTLGNTTLEAGIELVYNGASGGTVKIGDWQYHSIAGWSGTTLVVNNDNNLINTYANGNEIGIVLNFSNNFYSFGDFNQIYNGTALKIDDTSQYIRTYNGNNIEGLHFDFPNGRYYFGEVDITNTGTQLFIDAFAQTFTTKNNNVRIGLNFDFQNNQYAFGDFDAYNNNIALFIYDDGGTEKIFTHHISGDVGIKLDFYNKEYFLGDFDNTNGNTRFIVSDSTAEISWYSEKKPKFDDNGTGNMITNAPGVPSLDKWRVNINGQDYLIPLSLPPT